MLTKEQLKEGLKYFYGTEKYHKLSIYDVYATDGVTWFCDNAECYWLFEEIAHHITRPLKNHEFIFVKTISKNNHAVIKFENGNNKLLLEKEIPFTDLPEGEWKFFVSNYPNEKVIMLPSEY